MAKPTSLAHVILTSILLTSTLATTLVVQPQKASASFENGNSYCITGDSSSSSSSSSDSDSNSDDSGNDDSGGASTPKGHVSAEAVNNVKKIAKHMNDEYGFGENQLAVIMAVALRESTWQVTAQNSSGQVAGLFQWGYG